MNRNMKIMNIGISMNIFAYLDNIYYNSEQNVKE